MESNTKKKEHKISFIGVRDNKNVTTYGNGQSPSNADEHISFGIPRYFVAVNLTTHMKNIPFAKVDWIRFKVTSRYRNTIVGIIQEDEWQQGPKERSNVNSYLPIMDALPSRFVLAYDPVPHARTRSREIGFIGIDQDKLGHNMIDLGHTVDFDSNTTQYKVSEYYDGTTNQRIEFTETALNFLKTTFVLEDLS